MCRITYVRMLDADVAGADWREVARIVLHIDPDREPDWAWQAFESHLARARWMTKVTKDGYRICFAAAGLAPMPDWDRAFDDPIPLPNGRVPKALHDAGHYAAALPKAAQEQAAWQAAAEMLILAAEGQRPVIFAEIAVRCMQASPPRRQRHGTSRPGRKGSFARVALAGPPLALRRRAPRRW